MCLWRISGASSKLGPLASGPAGGIRETSPYVRAEGGDHPNAPLPCRRDNETDKAVPV